MTRSLRLDDMFGVVVCSLLLFSFARRTACFQCGVPKPPNARLSLVGNQMSREGELPVLMVKGLAETTEEGAILDAFSAHGQVKAARLHAVPCLRRSTPLVM